MRLQLEISPLEPTHGSLTGAIQAADSLIRSREWGLVRGRTVERVLKETGRVAFLLVNGHVLVIHASPDSHVPKVRVEDRSKLVSNEWRDELGPTVQVVVGDECYTWDRETVFEEIAGKPLSNVGVFEWGAIVGTQDLKIWFRTERQKSRGTLVLTWEEID